MTEEYDKYLVAKWFLSKKSMSPKKLQKILYYAYAWGLVFFNEDESNISNKVFDGKFEAWVHGPVDKGIYYYYSKYGYQDIPTNEEVDIKDSDVLDLFNQVLEMYGDFGGNQLEQLTHSEQPWKNARGDAKPLDIVSTTISDKDMFVFYGQKQA